ncbi:hypothetical protein N2V14_004154 [Vibrio fluvialis]|nr:hypothetical protein [Vibrio fluvialis]
MTIADILTVGGAVLASLGGASVIIIAASSWLAKVWANRILETEKGNIQRELEYLKSSNQVYLGSVGTSSSLYVESHKSIVIERTNAIKELWATLIAVKETKPSILIFLDLLHFSQYHQIHTNKNMASLDESISFEGLAETMKLDAQKVRPFIDEKAFQYFWGYRALIGRLGWYVRGIREDGAPEVPWQETEQVREILLQILDAETVEAVKNEKWKVQVLLEHIELLLVEHLRELASGKIESTESVSHLADISKTTAMLREQGSSKIPS